ncbi:SH3 domain-containing protein [Treponema sp. R80B11-R83G3]
MKNKKSKARQIGISLLILIVAVIGLSMTACTKKAEGGGTTVIGIVNAQPAGWERIDINNIIEGNGKFVTTGLTSGENQMHTIAYSGDKGETWKAANTPFPKLYQPHQTYYLVERIVYGNGKFAAYGSQNTEDAYGGWGRNFMMAYSKDGVNWKKADYPWPDGARPAGLAFGNGTFVLGGNIINEGGPGGIDEYTGLLMVSTDGTKWKEIKDPILDKTNIIIMSFGNGIFFINGYNDNSSFFAASTDGVKWSKTYPSNFPSTGIAIGNGRFVAVGSNVSSSGKKQGDAVCAVSTDGVNWTTKIVQNYAGFYSVGFSEGSFFTMAYGYGYSDTLYSLYSTDGLNWSDKDDSAQTSTQTAPQTEIYYAATNLRLRSEPDTSKDNRIAGVPQGSKVELIEVGNTETIDKITAPWYKVKTADGTVGWLFSGYLSETAPVSYDYSKILKGDLSDFVGEWKNGNGQKYQLIKDGAFVFDVKEVVGVKTFDYARKTNGSYTWITGSSQEAVHMELYPVGLDITDVQKFPDMVNIPFIQSDTTKVRLFIWGYGSTPDDVFYKE